MPIQDATNERLVESLEAMAGIGGAEKTRAWGEVRGELLRRLRQEGTGMGVERGATESVPSPERPTGEAGDSPRAPEPTLPDVRLPYKAELIGGGGERHWRISTNDKSDDRVATCYVEGNAKLVTDALNRPLHADAELRERVARDQGQATLQAAGRILKLRGRIAELERRNRRQTETFEAFQRDRDAAEKRIAELQSTVEAQADPDSVGNPAWLARQMEDRALKAEADLSELRTIYEHCEYCRKVTAERYQEINAELANSENRRQHLQRSVTALESELEAEQAALAARPDAGLLADVDKALGMLGNTYADLRARVHAAQASVKSKGQSGESETVSNSRVADLVIDSRQLTTERPAAYAEGTPGCGSDVKAAQASVPKPPMPRELVDRCIAMEKHAVELCNSGSPIEREHKALIAELERYSDPVPQGVTLELLRKVRSLIEDAPPETVNAVIDAILSELGTVPAPVVTAEMLTDWMDSIPGWPSIDPRVKAEMRAARDQQKGVGE